MARRTDRQALERADREREREEEERDEWAVSLQRANPKNWGGTDGQGSPERQTREAGIQ